MNTRIYTLEAKASAEEIRTFFSNGLVAYIYIYIHILIVFVSLHLDIKPFENTSNSVTARLAESCAALSKVYKNK